jgi:Zn-dependent peptidase ImmA (M78 family)/transcriptional regulator with XRE-family HTH domain
MAGGMRVGTPGFSGARLREAREVRGLQGVFLAELIGVSPQAISQYENGRSTPSPEVLSKLARGLNVPERFLVMDDREPRERRVFYRSMSAATKSARSRAEHRALWLGDIVSYVSEFVELPKSNLPDFELSGDPLALTNSDIEEIAVDTRGFWGMRDGPIANMVALLENQGVIVARDRLGAATLDSLSERHPADARPYVLIGTDKGTSARWRFDAAHELGHMILHSRLDRRRLASTADHKIIENQAHRFAGAFLLPRAPFTEDFFAASLDVMTTMKPKWKTSIAMMIMRARQTHLISDETERRLWINYSRRGWRKHEPLDESMEIELPRVLYRSFELVLTEGSETPHDVVATTGLPAADIESLSGLPTNYLQQSFAPVLLREPPTAGNNVTPLRRRSW